MEATKEKGKWDAKRISKLVVDIVCWIFFAVALVFTVFAFTAQASNTGFPTIGKKALLTVESDSMEGEHGFYEGDLIITKILPDISVAGEAKKEEYTAQRKEVFAELKTTVYNADNTVAEWGDVITFKKDLNGDGTVELNTHRIVEVRIDAINGHYYFVTRGDNVGHVDPYEVVDNDVVGVWTGKRIAGMGSFISFLQPPHVGFFVFIILPLAGFLAYEIVILVLTVKKMKGGSNKRTISKAEEELIKQQAVEEYLRKQQAEKENSK